MVLLCVPTWVMPAAAAEVTDTEKTVYVRFRLADARDYGYTGTVVSETAMAPGFASIVYPTDLQLLSHGIKPSDVLGWYHIQPDGTFVDASAYNGQYLTDDVTFYPYLKKSSMGFVTNTANLPIVMTNSNAPVVALRGGWNAGVYIKDTGFTPFNISGLGLANVSGRSAWSYGGCYYASQRGPVLSIGSDSVTALSWTAIADGKVDLTFDKIKFLLHEAEDKAALNMAAYVAVALNDTIIWPTAIAGQSVVTTGFAAAGWHHANVGNTTAVTSAPTVNIPTGYMTNVEVKAGDTIRFIYGYAGTPDLYTVAAAGTKNDNNRSIDCWPTVSYTDIETDTNGDAVLWDQIAYTLPTAYEPAKPLDASQAPVLGAVSDTEPEVSYPGSWSMIVYDDKASIANSDNANEAIHYTKNGDNLTSFISPYKNGSWLSLFTNNEDADNWGAKYSISVKYDGTNGAATDAAGFRYTAEHAGYIKPSFDALSKHKLGWALNTASYNGTRIAIFVDGVMAWPNAGADATDLTKWYQPYTVDAEYSSKVPDPVYADMTDEVNALLENVSIYVQQGSHVDFLLTYAESVSIYGGSGNVVKPAVIYSEVFSTDFSAYATIGDSLALDFVSDASGFSFQPLRKSLICWQTRCSSCSPVRQPASAWARPRWQAASWWPRYRTSWPSR